jgi:hypothetical protein
MSEEKEIAYELVNCLWHGLDGFQEIWNKNNPEVKDKILEDMGVKAVELVKKIKPQQKWVKK